MRVFEPGEERRVDISDEKMSFSIEWMTMFPQCDEDAVVFSLFPILEISGKRSYSVPSSQNIEASH